MNTFTPVPPCPHAAVWMTNARECAVCWMARMAAETQTAVAPTTKTQKERA